MCTYIYLYNGESGQLAYFSVFFLLQPHALQRCRIGAVVQLPYGPFHKDKVM